MVAFSPAERDALAKAVFTTLCTPRREHYAKEGEGEWVTIGGGPGPQGAKHAGGTPVKISPEGTIAAGPDNLEGQHIGQVDQNKQGAGASDQSGPATGNPPPSTNTPPAAADNPANVPGAPRAGGPSVSAEKHAEVKHDLGDPNILAAYYHDGAFYFLHDDAEKASRVLDGATAVTHGGLRESIRKLVAAGHRVGIAEPHGETVPRQKPERQPKPESPRPLLDQPAAKPTKEDIAALPPEDRPSGFPTVGVIGMPPTPPKPAEKPPAAAAAPATAGPSEPGKAPKRASQKAEPVKPALQAADDFKLRSRTVGPDLPKPRQPALFDRFREHQDSAEFAELAKKHPTAAAIARGSGPHRLANELGESPPAGVQVTPEGLWTGTATLHAKDIQADPKRFQYKISGIGEKGVTKELADVRQYNPLYGGQLLVWRDPENGQTFVINGHHRHELASRSAAFTDPATGLAWNGEMQSYYIPAKTAAEARAIGALANMAEGRGTATDAAKFLRDSGRSIDDLQSSGISLRGKVAADAAHLKDLSSRAFSALAEGRLTEGRALAIGRDLKDTDLQDQLLTRIDNRDRDEKKPPYTDASIAEMAKEMQLFGKSQQSGGASLFGDDLFSGDSLLDERADLKAGLRNALSSEANIFRSVSSSRRVGKIQEEGKNVLDVEGNLQRAQQAEEARFLFDRLANTKGPLADAIQEAAQELRNAPRKKRDIADKLRRAAVEIIRREWGSSGKPGPDDAAAGEPEQYSGSRVDPSVPLGGAGPVRGAAAGRGSDRAHDGQSGSAAFRRLLAAALAGPVERYAAERYTAGLEAAVEMGGHKRTKAAANYRTGFANARCAACEHFQPGNLCSLVAGDVDAQAVCDLFTAERDVGEHAGRGPVSEPERYQMAAAIRRGIVEHYAA